VFHKVLKEIKQQLIWHAYLASKLLINSTTVSQILVNSSIPYQTFPNATTTNTYIKRPDNQILAHIRTRGSNNRNRSSTFLVIPDDLRHRGPIPVHERILHERREHGNDDDHETNPTRSALRNEEGRRVRGSSYSAAGAVAAACAKA